MAGRERAGKKNNAGEYAGDIWGNQLTPKPGSGRRRKNGMVIIDGVPHVQKSLFSGEELRVPFPDKPVNAVPDQAGATPTGTLFAKPNTTQAETQHALFISQADTNTGPGGDESQEATSLIVMKPREERKEYVHLRLPAFHMLALHDGKVTHFVPGVLTAFDATWNVAQVRPLYAASSTDRAQALTRLQEVESSAKEQSALADIQVFARPDEETRIKTSPLNYLQFIMPATQGEESVFLCGELQPSRSDPEGIALVGYSAIITPDYPRIYEYIQGQLRRYATEEEQPNQEDRPILRRFLQAMRGSETVGQKEPTRGTK